MTLSRRRLLSGGLTCAAALAGPAPTSVVAGERHAQTAADGLPGCDAKAIDEASQDFGHIMRRRPRAVYQPSSVTEVVELVGQAERHGLKIAARGRGHSTYGRSMAEDGIVIDMQALDTIHEIDTDRIVVGAGATWRDVLSASLSRGMTPPVLTNYLELSVGGTLAVGGIGGSSSQNGMQTDNVLELDVVTGDGRKLTCSAELNPDLFDAVRGGLGQCTIVTKASLRLVPAPERVRRFQLFYRDLGSLTADQRLVLAGGRFEQLQGAILSDGAGGWRYQLEGAIFYDGSATPDQTAILGGLSDDRDAAVISDMTYLEDASVFAKLEALLRSNGQWFNPHPWLLTFLRGSNAERLANEILQELTNEDIGPFGRITLYPLLTKAMKTPLVRIPDEDVAFAFNIIRFPLSDHAAGIGPMIAQNCALYERIRNAGGSLYPVSAFPMTRADWRHHVGSAWPHLLQAKKRYDPKGQLTPGYELF